MSLINYVLNRLLATIPILLGGLLLSFLLLRQMPDFPGIVDPDLQYESSPIANPSLAFGYDAPVISQFWFFLQNIFVKGEWGKSLVISPGKPVWQLIWEKAPRTLEIQIITTILASSIGIQFGVYSAVNKRNYRDTFMRIFTSVLYSMPIFLLAIILRFLFTQVLQWFPTQGYITVMYHRIYNANRITGFAILDSLLTGNFFLTWDILIHAFLPVMVLVIGSIAGFTRYIRSSMLEVLELDYIRSARAKGCTERTVIHKHALRNSMIPAVTLIGMNFSYLIVGTTLIEYTFNIYGLGQLYLDAITNQEFFLIQALILFIIGLVLFMNLLTDIMYGVLDPRVRM